jgi:hypothetical protein
VAIIENVWNQQIVVQIFMVFAAFRVAGKALYEQAQVFLDASAGKKSVNK